MITRERVSAGIIYTHQCDGEQDGTESDVSCFESLCKELRSRGWEIDGDGYGIPTGYCPDCGIKLEPFSWLASEERDD